MVSSGVTNGGWIEVIFSGYGGIEPGLVLYMNNNYLITDKFSIGAYFQANLYVPIRDDTHEYINHNSPSAFSLRLSFATHF